jgi:hypothetical protein
VRRYLHLILSKGKNIDSHTKPRNVCTYRRISNRRVIYISDVISYVLPSCLQHIRFTLFESIRFPDALAPRLVFLYRFIPFNSCSSPSSFPSFHNLFSDLLSTILPGTDKGVVQSQLSDGRKGNTVIKRTDRHSFQEPSGCQQILLCYE